MPRFTWKTGMDLNRNSVGTRMTQSRGKVSKSDLSKVSVTVVLAVVMLSAGSCKKAPPTGEISSTGSGKSGQQIEVGDNVSVSAGRSFAHVTFKPEVKMVEKAAVDASIQGIGSDGHGVVFKNAPPEILALKAGDILMVKNAFAAKVLAAETDGDQTVLVTDRVGLAEVVQQGQINVDNAITFHGPKVAYAPQVAAPPFSLMGLIETPVYAQSIGGIQSSTPTSDLKSQVVDAILQGWKIEKWSVTPADNKANLSVRMTKNTNGFKAAISVDGSITNFQFASNITFPGAGNQMIAGVQGMSGNMHFVWEIGKDTPGVWAQEDKIKLPAGFSIPLGPFYKGVPLSIDISSAFLIHPALTGGNEYSKGGFTIGWVGSKSAAAAKGDGSEGLTFAITDDANVSAVAPTAMVISFCIPRIELKFSALGSYSGSNTLKVAAAAIDATIDKVASKLLPASLYNGLKASPIGKMSASNILASSADLFVQIIHTEGVTHSSNISLAQCTKTELKVLGQAGGDAKLFGLTDKASATKDLFTKTFTQWDPGSDFCKGV